MSVLIKPRSPSLSALGSEYLDFNKTTVIRDRHLLLTSHEMKVPGLNACLLHDGTIVFIIPALAWLVQRLLNLTVVLDSWIDPPRGDMPPIQRFYISQIRLLVLYLESLR